jgi:anti-sigma factor RsiW
MSDKHEHLDEGTIHAWIDGALPPDESARVESLATACTECAALVAEARGLVAASSRILSSLDAVPGGVIPGVESGTDQLAALRARRRETSRRWWNDRRFVVAASLVFVAGVSSLVWRSASNNNAMPLESEQDAIVAQPSTDTAMPTATAPASVPAERMARDARVGAAAPVSSPAPRRLANTSKPDSVVEPKVVAAEAALPRRANVAANESRRMDSTSVTAKSQLVDSIGAQRAAQPTVAQVQLQQGGAAQGQQALRQGAERSRATAPPTAFGAGSRLGSVVTTGVAADMAVSSRNCYRLVEPLRANAGIIADSVQLLNETPLESSDSTWYRARAAGWADYSLVWRPIDSTTVELRSRIQSNRLVVRFSTTPTGFPLPEPGREPGVRIAMASATRCR